jgi:hypothetical protein
MDLREYPKALNHAEGDHFILLSGELLQDEVGYQLHLKVYLHLQRRYGRKISNQFPAVLFSAFAFHSPCPMDPGPSIIPADGRIIITYFLTRRNIPEGNQLIFPSKTGIRIAGMIETDIGRIQLHIFIFAQLKRVIQSDPALKISFMKFFPDNLFPLKKA